jgi:hypothetical protein
MRQEEDACLSSRHGMFAVAIFFLNDGKGTALGKIEWRGG